jgi:hypothetical protein
VAPALSGVNLDDFVLGINSVKPSKIRIEADEVTYSLHVIVRFQIEKDLFNGKTSLAELPAIWNQKYEEYLGVKVQNDSEGVMQDTHWSSGMYGYFPSYDLGNLYSGHLIAQLTKEIQDWRDQLQKGNLKKLLKWLKENVHSYGKLYDTADLLRKITGKNLDANRSFSTCKKYRNLQLLSSRFLPARDDVRQEIAPRRKKNPQPANSRIIIVGSIKKSRTPSTAIPKHAQSLLVIKERPDSKMIELTTCSEYIELPMETRCSLSGSFIKELRSKYRYTPRKYKFSQIFVTSDTFIYNFLERTQRKYECRDQRQKA